MITQIDSIVQASVNPVHKAVLRQLVDYHITHTHAHYTSFSAGVSLMSEYAVACKCFSRKCDFCFSTLKTAAVFNQTAECTAQKCISLTFAKTPECQKGWVIIPPLRPS